MDASNIRSNDPIAIGSSKEADFGRDPKHQNMKKEALMNMIAQEMVTSLLGSADDEDDDNGNEMGDDEERLEDLQKKLAERIKARKKATARRKSASKKLQQHKDASVPRKPSKATTISSRETATTSSTSEQDDIDLNVVVKDDDSFAGGCLDDLVDHQARPAHRRASYGSGPSRRASYGSGPSRRSSNGSGRNDVLSRSERTSGSRSSRKSGRSSSGMDEGDATSRTSKELSIEEIRQYVLDNIPPAVREQIPEEAWGQIFGGGSKSPKSKNSSKKSASAGGGEKKRKEEEGKSPIGEIVFGGGGDDGDNGSAYDDDVEDDITVYSEVSGLTSAFPDGKTLECRRESMSHYSQKPTLQTIHQGGDEGSRSKDSTTRGSRSTHHTVDDYYGEEEKKPESAQFSASAASSRWSNGGPNNYIAENASHRQLAPAASTLVHVSSRDGTSDMKVVRFGDISVRYYERIVTDNPSVQSGPAIGIGWRFKRGGVVSVDYWEQANPTKRKSAELVLPRHVRESMLREVGFTQKEVADMVRVTLRLKNQRKQTVNNLSTAGIEEAVEKATRKVTRLLRFGRNKDIISTQ